jgi:hypothetical protein
MKRIMLVSMITVLALQAMDEEKYHCNTYKGKEINPQSLLYLMPKMPVELKQQVKACMQKHKSFISKLVTTPHPLSCPISKEKTASNKALIEEYEKKGKVKNLSDFNYILRFTDYPGFTVPINVWGSRMANLMYSAGEGNVLDPNFTEEKRDKVDYSKFEYLPSYQHCSRGAHYLRVEEAIEKGNFKSLRTTPTYLVRIPGKPKVLSDENYVPIQVWVDNIKTVKEFGPEKALEIRKNIPLDALKEIHEVLIYAALWDITFNLSVDDINPYYYILDLEEPFNHKNTFFYFRGEEGERKYVEDVVKTLERMAKVFLEIPEQFERWRQLTENHVIFRNLCQKYNMYPNFDPEYLRNNNI